MESAASHSDERSNVAVRCGGVIDFDHLARYTLGDRALEEEILQLFALQLPQTMDRLAQAATDREWFEAAHTLKGSARAVGAMALARLAEAAETSGGPSARRAALAALGPAVAETARFVAAWRRDIDCGG